MTGQTIVDEGLYEHSHPKRGERDMFSKIRAKVNKVIDKVIFMIEGSVPDN